MSRRTDPGDDIWFPVTSVVALLVADGNARPVQSGLVSRAGCIGLEMLFPVTPTLGDAIIQIAGEMSVIPAALLRSVAVGRPAIHGALARFLTNFPLRRCKA